MRPNTSGTEKIAANRLFETVKLNGVDPQAWLIGTLDHIADHKITCLDKLMLWRYAQT
ncbi:MAG: transposase domain-containing protein [Hyphomicrobiaceae bacterium]|nr:transposase domain-containing protein [Hyphomicrobiaceae bacterium]